jgi:hypothetical protein
LLNLIVRKTTVSLILHILHLCLILIHPATIIIAGLRLKGFIHKRGLDRLVRLVDRENHEFATAHLLVVIVLGNRNNILGVNLDTNLITASTVGPSIVTRSNMESSGTSNIGVRITLTALHTDSSTNTVVHRISAAVLEVLIHITVGDEATILSDSMSIMLKESEKISTGTGVGIGNTVIPELDKRLKRKTDFNEVHDTVRKHLGTLLLSNPHIVVIVGSEKTAGVTLKLHSFTEVTSLDDGGWVRISFNKLHNLIKGGSADRHDFGHAAPKDGEIGVGLDERNHFLFLLGWMF